MDELTKELLRYLMDPKTQRPDDNRLFARLAAERPVLRLGPVWVFSRYDLVAKLTSDPSCVLRLPDQWPDLPHRDQAVTRMLERLIPLQPPADHRRLRRLVASDFSASSISRLSETVNGIVDELFAPALVSDECDFIADICRPLPVFTTMAMLGIPREDRDYILTWARRLNDAILEEVGPAAPVPGMPAGPVDSVIAAADTRSDRFSSGVTEVLAYIENLVRQRHNNPGTDLVSRLNAQADRDDSKLTHDELVAIVAMLFMTGIDTVGSSLANVVLALSRRPDVWREVVADQTLASKAFLEGNRLHPAVPMASRIAATDISLADSVVPQGSTILLVYGAANLDSAVFDQANEFDLHRSQVSHFGFGHGPHYCLGASLAILQGVSVLTKLAKTCPQFEILEGVARRRDELAFHSVSELRLRLNTRQARPSRLPA